MTLRRRASALCVPARARRRYGVINLALTGSSAAERLPLPRSSRPAPARLAAGQAARHRASPRAAAAPAGCSPRRSLFGALVGGAYGFLVHALWPHDRLALRRLCGGGHGGDRRGHQPRADQRHPDPLRVHRQLRPDPAADGGRDHLELPVARGSTATRSTPSRCAARGSTALADGGGGARRPQGGEPGAGRPRHPAAGRPLRRAWWRSSSRTPASACSWWATDGKLQGAVSLHDIKHALEHPETLTAVVAHDLMLPVEQRDPQGRAAAPRHGDLRPERLRAAAGGGRGRRASSACWPSATCWRSMPRRCSGGRRCWPPSSPARTRRPAATTSSSRPTSPCGWCRRRPWWQDPGRGEPAAAPRRPRHRDQAAAARKPRCGSSRRPTPGCSAATS